jgi:hypothetical protein
MDLPDQYSGIGPDLSEHFLSKNRVEGILLIFISDYMYYDIICFYKLSS